MTRPRSGKHSISNHRNAPTIHRRNHSSRHRRRNHSTRHRSHSSHHSWKLPAQQHSPRPRQPRRRRPLQQRQQQVPSFCPLAAGHSSSAAAATYSLSAAEPLVGDTLLVDTDADFAAPRSSAVFERHRSYPRYVGDGPRERFHGYGGIEACAHQLSGSIQD